MIGQTQAARAAKGGSGRSTREWDEQSLAEEVSRRAGSDAAAVARSLITWADALEGVRVEYGRGSSDGSAKILLDHERAALQAFRVWSYGSVEIPFDFMGYSGQAPFGNDRGARDELRRRISEAVPGSRIPPEEQRPRPSFSLKLLSGEDTLRRFLEAINWAFGQARQAQLDAPSDGGDAFPGDATIT